MNVALFSQLSTLGSSVVLLFGIVLLCRRSLHAYIEAFRWQSLVLAALLVIVGHFGEAPELYIVAVFFRAQGDLYPALPGTAGQTGGAEPESQPYRQHHQLAGDRRTTGAVGLRRHAPAGAREPAARAAACRWRWG